jgi:DNA-binding transcriptional regulator YiaG
MNVILRAEGRTAVVSGRMRAIRESARLSQRELAAALNVAPTAVALWEKGETLPRGAAAERLASLLRQLEGMGLVA